MLDYLKSLTWDQQPHISRLAAHFSDTNGVIGLYLRKWAIGAVARAYTGAQNAGLVLDGAQGLGKSRFVRWLCPLPKLFVDLGGIRVGRHHPARRCRGVERLLVARSLHRTGALWPLRDREAWPGLLQRHRQQRLRGVLGLNRLAPLLGHHPDRD